ncbi:MULTISPECIES: hypothetical protein [unclassified Amycolatopsis]|uniref:hypothetical protein n=1 Tax=unclassified Amycolatopsis TaxID=2618356 RepID=UPI002E1EB9A3|nr:MULTISPECIES: hypothetical protein [unclassified Amycolatopsis]
MAKVNWSERGTPVACRLPAERPHRASRLIAVLREARQATGRNPETGRIEPGSGALSGNWLGAVGYLMLVDQVGSAYRPAGVPAVPGPPVVRALRYFAPGVGEPEREALYALRCSLVHDFGLVSVGGPGRTHHFMLDDAEGGPIVRLPPEPWDGRAGHCRRFNATWVNLRALGDLAEDVFRRLSTLPEPAAARPGRPASPVLRDGPARPAYRRALSTRAASGDRKPVGGGT